MENNKKDRKMRRLDVFKMVCRSTYPPYLYAILISSSTLAAAAVFFLIEGDPGLCGSAGPDQQVWLTLLLLELRSARRPQISPAGFQF